MNADQSKALEGPCWGPGENRGGRAGTAPVAQEGGFKNGVLRRLVSPWLAYLHASALGCPKPIRNQYKADGKGFQ